MFDIILREGHIIWLQLHMLSFVLTVVESLRVTCTVLMMMLCAVSVCVAVLHGVTVQNLLAEELVYNFRVYLILFMSKLFWEI